MNWVQIIIAFIAGAFLGPWLLSMVGGKKSSTASGGGY